MRYCVLATFDGGLASIIIFKFGDLGDPTVCTVYLND